jgi:hypothetical protein
MATYTSPFSALKAGSKQEYGLQVSWTADYNTVTLSPGVIYASDEVTPMVVSAQLTATMTAMGGSEPTNALAYPWLGVNAGGTPSFWLDTSLSSPTLTPAGIVAKRYIGPALRNDGGQNMTAFTSSRVGRTVNMIYTPPQQVFLATGDLSTPVAFSVEPFVSSLATEMIAQVVGITNEASAPLYRQFNIFANVALTAVVLASGTEAGANEQNWVTGVIGCGPISMGAMYYNCTVSTFTIGIFTIAGFTEQI